MANTNTGRFLLKGKKADSEIDQFESLIKKKPDDDRAHVRLAELYARAGNEDKAIELYEKAALLFEKKGFLNKAKAVLKQALMLNPEHGKINVLLADFDRQSGLIKDATMRYQTAVNYYARIGNKLAAINILRKIVELYPGNINFSIKLANMLVSEKMNHEAEKLLSPVAESLKGTDKVNEYAAVLKLLYTATDNDSSVGKDLVNLYLKSGSYTNALAVLQKLIVDDPEAIEFLEKLAFVFEKLGEKRKLTAIYKQIAVVCSQRQNFAERDVMYRKVLEIDPNDREALSVLNEEGRLRELISGKIDSSSNDFHDNEGLDLILDIDIEGEDEGLESEEERPSVDIETVLKEAGVFLSYRLFSKAIDKIQSCSEWKTSPEAIDILIQSNIENGEVETAGDLIISLIDLMIERGQYKEAKELLNDAESILEKDDLRIADRKELIVLNESDLSEDIEKDNIFEGIPDLEKDFSDEEPLSLGDDYLDDTAEEPEELTPEQVDQSSTDDSPDAEINSPSEFENMTMDILSELQEPPQERLDELEFYISIEDFASATQLLQELLVNFPDSRFLSGIKEVLPMRKEEDLSGTIKDVKGILQDSIEGDTTTDQLHDLGISHLSMGMFTEAISLFNQALEMNPGDIRCMIGLSQAWTMAEKPDKALNVLKEVRNLTQDEEMLSAIDDQISEIEQSMKKTKSRKKGG